MRICVEGCLRSQAAWCQQLMKVCKWATAAWLWFVHMSMRCQVVCYAIHMNNSVWSSVAPPHANA
jgi:hypothetical protein